MASFGINRRRRVNSGTLKFYQGLGYLHEIVSEISYNGNHFNVRK